MRAFLRPVCVKRSILTSCIQVLHQSTKEISRKDKCTIRQAQCSTLKTSNLLFIYACCAIDTMNLRQRRIVVTSLDIDRKQIPP
jgi:hypothetical protein